MKKTDVSIHFTLKNQSIDSVNEKLHFWINRLNGNLPFDFSDENKEEKPILHHCFLPLEKVKEKGFPEHVHIFLNTIAEKIVCWNGASNQDLAEERKLMLQNIKKTNGVSVFIGDVKDGVKEELEIARQLDLDIIIIP